MVTEKSAATPQGQTTDHQHAPQATPRPDVGVQDRFSTRKPPKNYLRDSSLDPALSWDASRDRILAEWLQGLVQRCSTEGEAAVPAVPLLVHERHSTKAILGGIQHRKAKGTTCNLFGEAGGLDVTDKLDAGSVPHITLSSITNEEQPAVEVLVDGPEENNKVTRVAGLFVVEATTAPSQTVQLDVATAEQVIRSLDSALSESDASNGGLSLQVAEPAGADAGHRR